MNTKLKSPKTLMEAVKYFADADVCQALMVKVKWPSGEIHCPKCGATNIGTIASRRMFQCKNKECRKQFSAKVGTIFEDSPLPLDKWFVAMWSITNAKNGISSCELARAIGVCQKTAWHMLHRIRLALKSGNFGKMSGRVEADEAFIGGSVANMHKSKRPEKGQFRGGKGKAVVAGLLERGECSKVRADVIEASARPHLHKFVKENVADGSELLTDAHHGYWGMTDKYIHQAVDHAVEYVRDHVHTNGLENFWALLRRALEGTYVAVEPFHLLSYLDEQTFRFNNRKLADSERMALAMAGIVGKKLTYAHLTGKVGPVSTPMA